MNLILVVSFFAAIGTLSASPIFSNISLNAAPIAEPTYRLPQNTQPISYVIDLETNVHKNIFTFTGTVAIKLVVLETQDNAEIVLHARQLKKFKVKLVGNGVQREDLIAQHEATREFLTIKASPSSKDPLNFIKGENYTLTISYEGELRKDNGGFYRSSYQNAAGQTVYLATTQFESTDARHAFPCYDEPAMKATFKVSIKHGSKYSAISNTKVEGTVIEDDMVITKFKETPKMSTYLLAFVVSDFESSTLKDQRVFSHPGTKADQKFALDTGVQMLQKLGEYFHIKYELPKMDQVAVPDFAAGAMENWGLVTYREEYLLYNEKSSPVSAEIDIAKIIGHEYTHQWFGNLVSPKWWTYTWLNEGFATLFQYLAVELVYPEFDISQYFITADYQRALKSDIDTGARPMTYYIEKPNEISKVFDDISYAKAGSVLRMIQNLIGESNFRQGIYTYLQNRKFDVAEEDDLFEGLQFAVTTSQQKLPAPIKDIMKSWTTQGGYPLLTVTRNYKTGTFVVQQETFTNSAEIKDPKLWWVPFNFFTNNRLDYDDTTIDYFLKNTEKSIEVKPIENKKWSNDDWVILNKQQMSYFRVNYDEDNWNLIINTLKKTHEKIHILNRAQLIDDAYNLAITKRLSVSTLFELMSYLKSEKMYAPWKAADVVLSSFNKILKTDRDYEEYQFFIKYIVEDLYHKLGTEDKATEPILTRILRGFIISRACDAGSETCLKDTKNKIQDLIKNNKEINPNTKKSIYCTGLTDANEDDYGYFYNRLMQSSNAAERKIIISGLGCMQDSKLLKSYLESSISEAAGVTLRPQERITILSSAYQFSENGLFAAIDFLVENFDKYSKLTPGFGSGNPLNADLIAMSKYVVNKQQKQKFDFLVQTVKNHPQVDKEITSIVDLNVQSNLDWASKHRDELVDWLKEFHKKNGAATLSSLSSLIILISAALNTIFGRF